MAEGPIVSASILDDNVLLHLAVIEDNFDVVKFLLKHDVPVNGRIINNQLSLKFATDHEYENHMKSLLDKENESGTADDNSENKAQLRITKTLKSTTALHLAAQKRTKDMAELLLERGADVNSEMEGGETPLIIAVLNNAQSIIELLIQKGANVNARTVWGKIPLHYAAHTGHREIAEFLLERGAHVNSATLQGMTPLHIAAESGHIDVVDVLLENDADVNIKNVDGATALHFAVMKGHKKIFDLMIDHGADINILLKNGKLDLSPFERITPFEEKRAWSLIAKYTNKLSLRNIINTWIFTKKNRDGDEQ